MLFHSSLRKELARSFGATLIVLVTVIMTMTLIRTLGQVSRGSFNPSDVMLVMGYTVLAYMPTILTMALFVAIVATLSRLYQDSEMVIWFSSGRGLSALIRPLYRFAWPVLLVIAALAIFVLPMSNRQIEELKDSYEKRGDLERINPGQFQESANGTRVFFVEKHASGAAGGNNVFIATNENGRETLTSARSGRIETKDGARYLMLSAGQRLESDTSKTDIKISEFEQYGSQIDANGLPGAAALGVNTLSTPQLMMQPTPQYMAELSWRFGLAIAAFNLVLIGIAISNANPRVGRGGSLAFAFFAFVIYFNLLSLGQNWIANGQIQFVVFLLALHGGAFALGALWLAKRHNAWAFGNLFRRAATKDVNGRS